MTQTDDSSDSEPHAAGSSMAAPTEPYRLLHVEDDADAAHLISQLLALQRTVRIGHLDLVTTKAAALAAVTDEGPYDVVLLDLHLPDNLDVGIVDHLVAHAPTAAVIVLTGHDGPQVGIEALRRGASQFLSKTRLDEGLLSREILFATARKTYELRLRRLTRTDELTGLANRRAVSDYYRLAQEHIARDGGAVVTAFYDLNEFKPINDLFGHLTGDRVLRSVAQHLCDEVRAGDLVGRISGDEFMVMGIAHDDAEAADFADRLTHLIHELPVGIDDATITAAHGIITTDGAEPLEAILALADRAMYEDKGQADR